MTYMYVCQLLKLNACGARAGRPTVALVEAHLNLCLRKKTPVSTLSNGD